MADDHESIRRILNHFAVSLPPPSPMYANLERQMRQVAQAHGLTVEGVSPEALARQLHAMIEGTAATAPVEGVLQQMEQIAARCRTFPQRVQAILDAHPVRNQQDTEEPLA